MTTTANETAPETFAELHLSRAADGSIELHQPDHSGNADHVWLTLHPAQARRVGELAGLGLHDSDTRRDLARLRRSMLAIHERAAALADWLRNMSDHRHANLESEVLQANALADLTGLAVADFAPPTDATPPAPACACCVPAGAADDAQGVLL